MQITKGLLPFIMLYLAFNSYAQKHQSTFRSDFYLQGWLSYENPEFLTDKRFHSANHVKDSLFINFNDYKKFSILVSDSALNKKVYAVQIQVNDSTNLENCFSLLKRLPKLEFISIRTTLFKRQGQRVFQLPDNVKLLQNVKGINFYYTFGLDYNKAFAKLAALKQLSVLNIQHTDTLYLSNLYSLKQLKVVKATTKALQDIDFKRLKWEHLILTGDAPRQSFDQEVVDHIAESATIKNLQLEYINSPDLPILKQMPQLTKLSLNTIYAKPGYRLFSAVSPITQLQDLSISLYNDSTQIPEQLNKLRNLKTLSLYSFYSLSKNAESLSALEGLQQLNALTLVNCKLKTLPVNLSKLPVLQHLNVSSNSLKQLPDNVFELPNLVTLKASSNQLASIPDVKTGSSNLQNLNLEFNAITALPSTFIQLHRLVNLNVAFNKIQTLPTSGWEKMQLLKQANFSVNATTAFPDGIQLIPALNSLDLSYNNLSHFPDFDELPYLLKTLKLSGNFLHYLPPNMSKLKYLETLEADGNNLWALPESLGLCTRLKVLNLKSHTLSMSFDASKTRDNIKTAKDQYQKENHIASLPTGLKNARELEKLNLSGNQGIDAKSVFDVILSTPRPYFDVDLSATELRSLPATSQWAKVQFVNLDLSDNAITTLPAELGLIKQVNGINLWKNPLDVHPAAIYNDFNTREDLKILFDELGISIPDSLINKSRYSSALAKKVSAYYNQEQYVKAIELADRALAVDSTAYYKSVDIASIGLSRYQNHDYRGAIKDFDRFITNNSHGYALWRNTIDDVERSKANAHLALNEPDLAAASYIKFGDIFHSNSGYQNAAIIYLKTGKPQKAQQVLDSAVSNAKRNLSFQKSIKQSNVGNTLDFVELLIMDNKNEEAIAEINNQPVAFFSGKYKAIKDYLLATANYFKAPANYSNLTKQLTESVAQNDKITDWNFEMFNNWLSVTHDKTAAEKMQALNLQNIVK